MNLPILQLPQPWAWSVVAGLRHTHGVESAGSALRGPAAVVATTTNFGQSQACKFLRENGIAVPMKRDMPQGAFLGLVEISTSVRRQFIDEYLFLDSHPWQLVLVRPFALPVPERRKCFKYREGFPISEVLRALSGRREVCARGYVEQLRELELSS